MTIFLFLFLFINKFIFFLTIGWIIFEICFTFLLSAKIIFVISFFLIGNDDIYLGKSLTNEQKLEFYGQDDHVRIYSKKNLIKKIEYAGFDLKLMNHEDFCSTNKKMGLIEEEKIFLAKKL